MGNHVSSSKHLTVREPRPPPYELQLSTACMHFFIQSDHYLRTSGHKLSVHQQSSENEENSKPTNLQVHLEDLRYMVCGKPLQFDFIDDPMNPYQECLDALLCQEKREYYGRFLRGSTSRWQVILSSLLVAKYNQEVSFFGRRGGVIPPTNSASYNASSRPLIKYLEGAVTQDSSVKAFFYLSTEHVLARSPYLYQDGQGFWQPVRVVGISLLTGVMLFLYMLKITARHRSAGASASSLNSTGRHGEGTTFLRLQDGTISTSSEVTLTINMESGVPSHIIGNSSSSSLVSLMDSPFYLDDASSFINPTQERYNMV